MFNSINSHNRRWRWWWRQKTKSISTLRTNQRDHHSIHRKSTNDRIEWNQWWDRIRFTLRRVLQLRPIQWQLRGICIPRAYHCSINASPSLSTLLSEIWSLQSDHPPSPIYPLLFLLFIIIIESNQTWVEYIARAVVLFDRVYICDLSRSDSWWNTDHTEDHPPIIQSEQLRTWWYHCGDHQSDV